MTKENESLGKGEEMTYSDEAVERAAVAAEDWHKHGDWSCRQHWENEDGFK
jgi:hypothetical protein